MAQDKKKQHDHPAQDPLDDVPLPSQGEEPSQAQDDLPSTEQEIDPGTNQDKHTGESFSSESATEASGVTEAD